MTERQTHSVLLYPPIYATARAFRLWSLDFSTNFPLGLLRLARYLKEQGHALTWIDALHPAAEGHPHPDHYVLPENKVRDVPMGNFAQEGRTIPLYRAGLSRAELKARLESLDRVDHVYISSIFTWTWETTHECVELCRLTHPEATIHLGGIYPTLCPEKAAESGADEVYQGDMPELDNLWPDLSVTGRLDHRVTILKTGVGCPNACSYCAVSLLEGRKLRFRDAEDVAREVRDTFDTMRITKFLFWESNLLLKDTQHFLPMMEALHETGLPLQLGAPEGIQADLVTEEVARIMYRGGFADVHLTLESTDEIWARSAGRPYGFAHIKTALENLLAAGFRHEQIICTLLVGRPGQTCDSILRDILSLYNIGLAVRLLVYTLIPGTDDHRRLAGDPSTPSLENLDPMFFPFASPEQTVADLEHLIRYFHLQYYPLERIRKSRTHDPMIRRMQAILRRGDFVR